MTVEDRIKDLMALSFMIERKHLNDDNVKLEDLGVDSLGVFELVVNIEDEFGVEIKDKEMLKFVTVKDTVAGLKKVIDQGLPS
jgi:acyl carrier protein